MHRKTPLVSAIIPVFNGAAHIRETLESVFGQTYPNLEVVVVNDASTDDSASILKSYADRITYIERSVNGGVAASRNTGILAARGEIIALIDQDDLWLPERVSRCVEAFTADPKAGLVACNVYIYDEKRGVRAPCWKRVIRTGDRITKRLLAENFICSVGATISRRALDEVGLFDESYYGADDYDLWYRISKRFKVSLIDEPLAIWRYRPCSLSSNTERMLEDVIFFYEKVLSVEEYEEERKIALQRRRELLFKLGIVQSLSGDDEKARRTFRKVAREGAPSFEASVAIWLHALSPPVFRLARSLRASRKSEIATNVELVI